VCVIPQIVADFLTIGLYNTNMERHAYPFLPEVPEGLEALKLSHQLQVADVMTPKIVAMPVVIRCVCVRVCCVRVVCLCVRVYTHFVRGILFPGSSSKYGDKHTGYISLVSCCALLAPVCCSLHCKPVPLAVNATRSYLSNVSLLHQRKYEPCTF